MNKIYYCLMRNYPIQNVEIYATSKRNFISINCQRKTYFKDIEVIFDGRARARSKAKMLSLGCCCKHQQHNADTPMFHDSRVYSELADSNVTFTNSVINVYVGLVIITMFLIGHLLI